MTRVTTALAICLACAFSIAVAAQDTKSKTVVKGNAPQMTTYTGCIEAGTQSKTYVIQHPTPVSRTTTTETTATGGVTTTTTTSWELVPERTVTIQEKVGQKVEVTGMMVPEGHSKVETKTEIEREHAPDVKIEERRKTEHAMPQFRVTSIKYLSEKCD